MMSIDNAIAVISFFSIYLLCPKFYAGSYPPFEKGWQRKIRFVPFSNPLKNPYFSIAPAVYWEQDG